MKSKTIIISLLLTLLIVGVTVGKTYFPIGLYAIGILVILLCLVFYVLKLFLNEKKYFEERYQTLNMNLDSAKAEILQNQTACKERIIRDLADKHLSINQFITKEIDLIQGDATKRTNTIINLLAIQSDVIDNKFKKETELIDSLSKMTQSLSSEIINKITNDSAKFEEILNKTAEQIINEEECTRKIIDNVSNYISSLLNSQRNVIENAIDTSTSSIAKLSQEHKDALIASVSELSFQEMSSRESLSHSLSNVLQKTEEQTQVVDKSLAVLQYKLDNTIMNVSEQTEKMNNTLKKSTDEIKNHFISESSKGCELIKSNISSAVSKIEGFVVKSAKSNNDNAELISGSLVEMTNTISNKIGIIEKQNQNLTNDIKCINDSRKSNSNNLQIISNQFNSLKNGLASVQIQSNNVEKLVNEFTKKNSNSAVYDSIKSMIAELRKELQTGVSGINDEILETQIKQESINNELDKLQVLLRNISKESIQETKIGREPSTHSSNTTSNTPWNSNILSQKQSEVKRTSTTSSPVDFPKSTKVEPNPNRTERIIDSETNNVVYNLFAGGKLAKSTMKDKMGKIIYELEYKDGKIDRSRNYDDRGIMNIEQTYYDNGQVHFRNQKTIKGTVRTEFDRNGIKK